MTQKSFKKKIKIKNMKSKSAGNTRQRVTVVNNLEETVEGSTPRPLVSKYSKEEQPRKCIVKLHLNKGTSSTGKCPFTHCHFQATCNAQGQLKLRKHIDSELKADPSLVYSPALQSWMSVENC